MRISARILASMLLSTGTFAARATAAPESPWAAVDAVFGQAGKDQAGDVHRFSWPRTDLNVRIGDVPIEPALALGSWGAHSMGSGAEVMGDLVLLESEVSPVVCALEAGGFEILAIHNHLIGETPRVMYVHYHGKGEAAALAQTLKGALGRSRTPLAAAAASTPVKATPEQEKTFQTVQDLIGRKGNTTGRVLQLSIPRAEPISENGMDVPPSMGMAIAINFQTVGSRVATTGDFVLVASEVNPVIRELHAHGIEATALHSHMLRETPRLFFLHFWGVDAPDKVSAGIKAALAKVNVK